MSSLDIEERRRAPRQRLGKLATIKLGIGLAPRYCLVSNISDEGVRIHVNGYEVLDEFVLIFPEAGVVVFFLCLQSLLQSEQGPRVAGVAI